MLFSLSNSFENAEVVSSTFRRRRATQLALFALLALTSCGRPTHFSRADFNGPLQCAPYARDQTGVALRGRAASWWWKAKGHYKRVHRPNSGAILVFKATSRIPSGHVSVVRKVVSSRQILVEHANWEPGAIDKNVPVVDVSKRNDWSLVRVYWEPVRKLGTGYYPTYGFILPK